MGYGAFIFSLSRIPPQWHGMLSWRERVKFGPNMDSQRTYMFLDPGRPLNPGRLSREGQAFARTLALVAASGAP